MSSESDTLERETLEKRSRDELHTIAETLGIKVGSRARKAELVDAILESAGVTDNGSGTDSSTDASDTGATDVTSSGGNGARRATAAGDAADPGADASGEERAGDSGDADGRDAPGGDGQVVRRRRRAVGYSAGPSDDADRAEAARTSSSSSGADDQDGSAGDGRNDAAAEDQDASAAAGSEDDTASSQAGEEASDAEEASQASGRAGSERSGSAEQRSADRRSDRKDASGQASDGDGSGRQSEGDEQSKGGRRSKDDQQSRSGEQDQGGGDQGAKKGDQDGRTDRNRNNNDRNQDGVAEPGNRRRRRRGRDRDRNQDDGPAPEPVEVTGLLDLRDEGYGFLRTKGFLPSKDDVYVSAKQARQLGLRKGDQLAGLSRPAARSEKNPAMIRIDTVNGGDPEVARRRPKFEDLTPLFPDQKLRLERDDDPTNMTNRIIDLISPIGKGQRGLIVSPPKAGKTMIIKQIAQAIEANNPECHLIVLLVDERPEEVTDMKRSIQGEVVASTFDRPSDEHTQVAELTIERAKRMVEDGTDVVIILDGITRLARAYNLAAPATGRIMSGGVDSGALYPPKRFFGAARNIEEGGSLTILATALIETGSKMDEVIFEEFKGTGNMELRLDRRLAERRIYPAIDVDASSTRHEELLFERKQLQQVWKLRRVLSGLSGGDGDGRPGAGLELLLDRLKTFRTNDDFLSEIAKAPSM